jgi:imidazole glycerol-phosphate synthase subunit HisF
MLKVRIIPVLLLRNGRMVKGVNFSNYRDTGDPVFASRVYNSQYVDELIFIDIDATNENRETNCEVIEQVSKECFMPFTIGGGITKVEQIRKLLAVGADKVVINTAAIDNPGLIKESSEIFGNQCIIVGIDVRFEDGKYIIYKNSGRIKTNLDLIEHIKNMEESGAGELFINSIDKDGMMNGYDLNLIKLVLKNTNAPVIACGGAGNFMHLVNAYKDTGIKALAMASIYHFGDNNPIRARSYLKNHNIEIKVV